MSGKEKTKHFWEDGLDNAAEGLEEAKEKLREAAETAREKGEEALESLGEQGEPTVGRVEHLRGPTEKSAKLRISSERSTSSERK